MVQDSSHGLKTDRNNLFSGACLLAFGNHVALYCHICQAAFEYKSPLYHRDVEKLDHQDNNAATRLHSATHINFLVSQHPDWLLEIVYLTVCGDFNDTWQSHSMLHLECIKLVFHTGYFFDMWAMYLDRCGYSRAQHYVSREFTDIIQFLINGATGVWTKFDHEEQLPEKTEVSLQCQLIRHFHEVLKEEQDCGLCTGSNHDKHWCTPAPSGRDADVDGAAAPVLNRNSANAAGAAASAASKV